MASANRSAAARRFCLPDGTAASLIATTLSSAAGLSAHVAVNRNSPPLPTPAVDYSLPPASSTLTLAVPPVPLPQARAHEAPGSAAVSLAELEGLMGKAAAEQEGELAELGQWFHGLPPAEKRAALASVAKSLSFQDAASAAPATLHLPAAGPSLTIFADTTLSSPAAETSAPVVAAPARRPLGDRTNTQAPVNMKQLSSKLHVAASRKQVPQVGAGWLGRLGAGWLGQLGAGWAMRAPA